MHTPDQARELWCPMVRLAVCQPNGDVQLGQTVMNRLQNGHNLAIPDASRCVVDSCAMWRWATVRDPNAPARSNAVVYDKPVPMVRNGTGYCGLSGRPEVMA